MIHADKTSFCLALLILLATVVAGAQAQETPPSDVPLQRILAGVKQPGPRFDDPDKAERHYAEQRLPAGEDVDAPALYAAALDHMERMPRYSARLGAYLGAPRQGGAPPKAELATWEFLGPGNIGGRTRALLIHPTKPRIRWAAGVSGGIWKSEDAGRSWRPLADLMPNLAVSSMAMDPDDPDVIYAGTGEGYFREEVRETQLPLRGAGIFKTEDGGETWTRLEETWGPDFRWVNDIAISHADPRRLYAATRSGVWRSLNAGRTWRKVLATQVKGGCLDLAIRTDRPADIVFASCGTFEQATVYRNAGAQRAASVWVPVLTEAGMGRTSLALAPSNQNVVYALSASYLAGPGGNFMGGLHAVFRSAAAGTAGSWQAVTRNTDPVKLNTLLLTNPVGASFVACNFDARDSYSTLGWYTNVIAVDPTDPDVVFAGGVDLFRSDDGGRNWGIITYWYATRASAHADQHAIVFHPRYNGRSNQTMFLGNDGGVWVTSNARAAAATGEQAACDPANTAVVWSSQDHNYGVTQFYHGAAFPDGRSYFGGTQDNGTLMGRDAAGSDAWAFILGGDGGYVAIDPRNPNVIYAESQVLTLQKSVDGGRSFQAATNGISANTGSGVDDYGDFLFIVPFTLDPNGPDRLYLGGRRLWRTANGAQSWSPASDFWPSGGKLSALAVSPGDPDRVVVGLDDGTIHYTDQALAAGSGTQWPAVRPRAGYVSWVAFDPLDPRRVYATYSTFGGKHVWTSDDGGATWRQIDGNGPRRLPNLPAHSIVADPTDPERLFVGTDLGVFVSTTGGLAWAVEQTGFANAVTESLQVLDSTGGERYLFAFTHGRGAWRVEIAEGEPEPQEAVFLVDSCPGQEGERFRVLMRDPALIAEAERLIASGDQRILIGELRAGAGGVNRPWSWHLDPSSLEFADVTVEVCSGCASFVEDDLDTWLNDIGTFCPWGARFIRRVR